MNEPDDEPEIDWASEKTREYQRFIALGGGIPIQQELRALKRIREGDQTSLAEVIGDGHRELVSNLAAAGVSTRNIARIFGISLAYLQKLFENELELGFDMAKANLIGALYKKGLAGETAAMMGFLRYHSKSDWRSKAELTGKDEAPLVPEGRGTSVEEAKTWLSAMVSGMMIDKTLQTKDTYKVKVPGADQRKHETDRETAKAKRKVTKPREESPDDDDQ